MKSMQWLVFLLAAGCTTTGNGEQNGTAPAPPATGEADRATARALHYTADMLVMESFPVQLDARMEVHNPLSSTAVLELPGGCPLQLLAYRDHGRSQLAWDQGHAIACTLQIQIVRLEPGAQHEFSARSDARQVLGDSLPDGTYYMSARLALNDTTIIRSVGAVQLAVPR